MAKVMTAKEAIAAYFYDGATVTFGGFANGLMHPEEIMTALEEAARQGHPRDLTVVYASGQGDSADRGLNHLAVAGLCKTVIGGHWGLAPKLGRLAAENKLAAYNLPQGVISELFREIAAKRPGVITHVGLDTFVDPRLEGGKINQAARDAGDLVKLIELQGEQKLFYPSFPIHIAVIRATYADCHGNCTFEKEGAYAEALAQAQAAHNSGGKVIVQVEKVVSHGCLDARLVRIPGIYVDALVVGSPENHMQTFGTRYDPAFSGEVRIPLDALAPLPMGERKIIARRAAMELVPMPLQTWGSACRKAWPLWPLRRAWRAWSLPPKWAASEASPPGGRISARLPMWIVSWSSPRSSTFMTAAVWTWPFWAWPKWTGAETSMSASLGPRSRAAAGLSTSRRTPRKSSTAGLLPPAG